MIPDLTDTFIKIIIGIAPDKSKQQDKFVLKASWIDTKLGPMIAIADDEKLYLLEFADRLGLEEKIEKFRLKKNFSIIPGETEPISMIKKELGFYFSGDLKKFKTPVNLTGSKFQINAWNELISIPYGQTRSYLQQAHAICKDKAFRAIANANSANQLAIIVPCHRIINNNGNLGGYAGGKARKAWLINHEKQNA